LTKSWQQRRTPQLALNLTMFRHDLLLSISMWYWINAHAKADRNLFFGHQIMARALDTLFLFE
jgi:hypothetical protein